MDTIVTPVFRVSFPNLQEPKAFENGKPKYSVVMLFDKKEDLKGLKALCNAAITKKWADATKRPKTLKSPFRDGDVERGDTDGYAGCVFITASSLQKPGIVYANKSIIPAALIGEELYAGCYARAVVSAYAYDKMGNKGVAIALQHIQKVKDGDAFSGRMKLEDAFDVIEGEEDPFSSEGPENSFL